MRWSCYGRHRRSRRRVALGCVNAQTKRLATERAFGKWPQFTFHITVIPYREDEGPLRKKARGR